MNTKKEKQLIRILLNQHSEESYKELLKLYKIPIHKKVLSLHSRLVNGSLTTDELINMLVKYKLILDKKQANAKLFFRMLQKTRNWYIIDVEATGNLKYPNTEIIEIAIIDSNKQILLNKLIKPRHPIPQEITHVHGITNDDVKNAPTWLDTEPQVFKLLKGKKVLSYNAQAERFFLRNTCKIWGLESPSLKIHCIANAYKDLKRSSRSISLEKAVGYKIKHRALNDCYALWDLITK